MVLLALDSCIKTAITVLSTKTFADCALFVGLSVRKKRRLLSDLINFCSVGLPDFAMTVMKYFIQVLELSQMLK